MKLDAEGSELAVLQGAQTALGQFQPIIVIEINGIVLNQGGISSAQVVDFLRQRRYRLFSITFRRLQDWNIARHGHFSDTLCLPENRLASGLERLRRAGFDLCD